MPSWLLLLLLLLLGSLLSGGVAVVAAEHARTRGDHPTLLPSGCLSLHLGGPEAEDWSPSFPLSRGLPVAIRSPQRAWGKFSFVFQRRDSTPVATLQVKNVEGNVELALRGRAYGAAETPAPMTLQVKTPTREGSHQLSLQDWTFVDLSVEGGRLEVALQGMAAVRFDRVNATRFHRVYAHVSKGQYVDMSFKCGEDGMQVEGGPASLSSSESLHGRAAAAVAVVIVVLIVLVSPTAVVCCCLRRRRKKMRRRRRMERVQQEAKTSRGAHVVSFESLERASLMARNVVAGDEDVGQEVVQDTAALEGEHSQQDAVPATDAGQMPDGQDDVTRVIAAGDISGESGGLPVTKGDSLISSHTMETDSRLGSEAPAPARTPDEEQHAAEVTDEDERNEPLGTNTAGRSASETNVRQSGDDGRAREPVGTDEGYEIGELGGNEVGAHEADEPGKDRAQKFLQGLSKTREQGALRPAGPYGREVSSLPDARSNSSNGDGAQGRREPAGTSGVGREANASLTGRLTDVINEMRDIQRESGTGVVRGAHKRTGDTGQETDDGESLDPNAQSGLAEDATRDTSRETGDPNKPSTAAEGLEEDDTTRETVARESMAPREDSTQDDDTMGKSKTEDGGGGRNVLGESEENTRRTLSTIVFPIGDSDYGVERFKESGIEAMYLETPREETYIKTQPKKIYRSTPLTSLKLP